MWKVSNHYFFSISYQTLTSCQDWDIAADLIAKLIFCSQQKTLKVDIWL